VTSNLSLTNQPTLGIIEDVLDGIFQGDQQTLPLAECRLRKGSQCGRLSGSGRTAHQDKPMPQIHQVVQ
jgi:hypothetical protein